MGWARWHKGPVLQTAFPPERSPIISFVSLTVAISNAPSLASRAFLYEGNQIHSISQSSGCVWREPGRFTLYMLPIKNTDRGKSNTNVTEKKVLPPTRGLKVTAPLPWPLSPAAKVRGAVCISGEYAGFHEASK